DELDASRGDVEDGGDRGGGVELLHRALLCSVVFPVVSPVVFPTMEKLRCVHGFGNRVVALNQYKCR
ncbi:hypothetical protein, partial [Streptomyces sp. T21Q-yed]|uniref:hypothetical protein n=1 Tax=Streptomyces sp. T21Q-yed TaxID=3018441 RepID=UPI0023E0189B